MYFIWSKLNVLTKSTYQRFNKSTNKVYESCIDGVFIKNLHSFKKDIESQNNKSIIKKLINAKKVRKQIIKLKQDTSKPDFGRND